MKHKTNKCLILLSLFSFTQVHSILAADQKNETTVIGLGHSVPQLGKVYFTGEVQSNAMGSWPHPALLIGKDKAIIVNTQSNYYKIKNEFSVEKGYIDFQGIKYKVIDYRYIYHTVISKLGIDSLSIFICKLDKDVNGILPFKFPQNNEGVKANDKIIMASTGGLETEQGIVATDKSKAGVALVSEHRPFGNEYIVTNFPAEASPYAAALYPLQYSMSAGSALMLPNNDTGNNEAKYSPMLLGIGLCGNGETKEANNGSSVFLDLNVIKQVIEDNQKF